MHEGDGHAALADGSGDALHRAEPDIATREDARNGGLEEVRVALELPASRGTHIGTREHVQDSALRVHLQELVSVQTPVEYVARKSVSVSGRFSGDFFGRSAHGSHPYVALTNAVAVSPTDTMPLTLRAKGLMAAESLISYAVIVLVVSRAVSVLGSGA
jgi:hypothetical protein